MESTMETRRCPRSVWMRREGAEIFNLATRTTNQAMEQHLESLIDENYSPSLDLDQLMVILYGPATDTPNAIITPGNGSLLYQVTEASDSFHQKLQEHTDDITHYTSVGDFARITDRGANETDDQYAARVVREHFRDGMRFAAYFSAGVAHDTISSHILEAEGEVEEKLIQGHITDDQFSEALMEAIHQAYESIGLWNDALFTKTTRIQQEQGVGEINPWELQRIDAVSRILANNSFQECLEELAIAGFNFWTASAASGVVHTITHAEENSLATHQQLSQQLRTKRFPDHNNLLSFDPTTTTYTVPPEVTAIMREHLKQQNTTGLTDKEKETAGNIVNLERPLSSGCPAVGTIGETAAFLSRALQSAVNTVHS